MLCETGGVVRILESRYSGKEDVPRMSEELGWVSGSCESVVKFGIAEREFPIPIPSVLPWELCVLKHPEEVRLALSDEVVGALFE